MNLNLDLSLVKNYTNNSQISRILTENWVKKNSFCLNCNNWCLEQFSNNLPVADFYCKNCRQEYELKSKNGKLSSKIVDGAYHTMVNRIEAENNPNFFFLTYDKSDWTVRNFLIIPKHYFVSDFIEKRKPLSENARRAGWTGCNILLDKIPSSGRIFLIKNSKIIDRDLVLHKWKETEFLKNVNKKSRGWIIDILNCIDLIPNKNFRLEDVYKFEAHLKLKYPNNSFIKDKIRQQLQILRDRDIIEFVSRGTYKKKTL
ncbi:MAG: restriction endonuclease [Sphingobacteriales bacterium]|nr:restriction endonuclease [Sphingobacteriales bacterium]